MFNFSRPWQCSSVAKNLNLKLNSNLTFRRTRKRQQIPSERYGKRTVASPRQSVQFPSVPIILHQNDYQNSNRRLIENTKRIIKHTHFDMEISAKLRRRDIYTTLQRLRDEKIEKKTYQLIFSLPGLARKTARP